MDIDASWNIFCSKLWDIVIFYVVILIYDKYKCQMQMQHACTYNDKYLRMYRMRMRWEYEQSLKIFQVLRMKSTYFSPYVKYLRMYKMKMNNLDSTYQKYFKCLDKYLWMVCT